MTAEERDTWVRISDNKAYFRDFFFGAETVIQGAQDGDTFHAEFTITPTGGDSASTLTFGTITFVSSYGDQQSCFVSDQGPPVCGGSSLDILWYTSGQCFDGRWSFQYFTNDAGTVAPSTFTVLPRIPPGKVPAYDQNTYPDDNYDTDCYTLDDENKKSAPYPCDGREGEEHWSIAAKGCALAACAMVASYHGYTVTPKELNDFYTPLSEMSQGPGSIGYKTGGGVDWQALPIWAGYYDVHVNGHVSDPSNPDLSLVGVAVDDDALKKAICKYGPQVLGVSHNRRDIQHFVTAVGWDNDVQRFLIMDPNGGVEHTLGDNDYGTYKNYGNLYFAVIAYAGPGYTYRLPGGFTITLHSPAALLLTDPSGLRKGVDPITASTYDEIQNANYFRYFQADQDPADASMPDLAPEEKELDVYQPQQGQYTLTVTGTGSGSYSMPMRLYDENLARRSAELVDIPTYAGLVNTYTFTYTTPFPASGPNTITLSGQLAGEGPDAAVNQFLTFASPVSMGSLVPAGQNNFPLIIFYGSTVDPASFTATLNGQDVRSLFSPAAGTAQAVNLPLPNGPSSLTLRINGTTSSGQIATDTVTLLFDVGGIAPSAPTGLVATAVSVERINLTWTASSSPGVTYSAFRGTTAGFAPSRANRVAQGLATTRYSDTGLDASTTYYYVVEAVDPYASSPASNQASATTDPIVSGGAASSITSSFNRAPIAGGNYIWFSSVLKPAGLGNAPATIFVRNSTITFSANGTDYSVPAPDANVVFSPDLTTATATFDAASNLWEITAPSGLAGDTLLDAVSFPVPADGLPGGIRNVTWTAAFSTDTTGVTLQWEWSAAVYPPSLGTDYSGLGVKPVDDPQASQYNNSDNAGTPENFKTEVISGAMGDGHSNYTGSYCAPQQSKGRDDKKHDHDKGRCVRDADDRDRDERNGLCAGKDDHDRDEDRDRDGDHGKARPECEGRCVRDADDRDRDERDGVRAGKDDYDRDEDRDKDGDDGQARPECGGSHPKKCPALVTPIVVTVCSGCGDGTLPS